jgi:hypothetical protein
VQDDIIAAAEVPPDADLARAVAAAGDHPQANVGPDL